MTRRGWKTDSNWVDAIGGRTELEPGVARAADRDLSSGLGAHAAFCLVSLDDTEYGTAEPTPNWLAWLPSKSD